MNKLVVTLLLTVPLAACERASHSATPSSTSATASPAAAVAAAPAANAAPAAAGAVGDDPSVPRIPAGTKVACAVTGEEFRVNDKTVQVTYGGKRYAFCCPDCAPTFNKNPAKFAK